MLIAVVVSIAVAGALVIALVFHLKGPRALLAAAARDFVEVKNMVGACLEQDLRTLDGKLAAAGVPAPSAHEHRRLAADHAARARAADGSTYWQEVSSCTEAAARAGRELAAARAAAAGEPVPPRTPPCLFDPAHGPSVANVEWAPAEGRARPVPACAADAAAVTRGDVPRFRHVASDEGEVPYFAAHGLYASWLLGYFNGFDPYLTAHLLAGTPLGAHLPDHIRAGR
jgi:hypothetical protein